MFIRLVSFSYHYQLCFSYAESELRGAFNTLIHASKPCYNQMTLLKFLLYLKFFMAPIAINEERIRPAFNEVPLIRL